MHGIVTLRQLNERDAEARRLIETNAAPGGLYDQQEKQLACDIEEAHQRLAQPAA